MRYHTYILDICSSDYQKLLSSVEHFGFSAENVIKFNRVCGKIAIHKLTAISLFIHSFSEDDR